LEESNREYIARNAELEEQNRLLPVLRAQIEAYKSQHDALQQRLSEMGAACSAKEAVRVGADPGERV
jgi:hypothetical protein